jgi:hypothetical protein
MHALSEIIDEYDAYHDRIHDELHIIIAEVAP